MAGVMERAAYRIIDANFNRAREALRVTEEYCLVVVTSTGTVPGKCRFLLRQAARRTRERVRACEK